MEAFIWILYALMPWFSQAKTLSISKVPRLSLAEPMPSYYYNNIDGYPGTYSFGYDVADLTTGNTHFRTEERYPNGTVIGSYGYIDPFGKPHRYRYIADERGYRVMRDLPYRPYAGQLYQTEQSLQPTESSITWTRGKTSNINHIEKKQMYPKIGTNRSNLNRRSKFVERPGHYISY